MPSYDTRIYPALSPYLYYEDTDAAMDWLIRVFGFRERLRSRHPDGRVGHGELELGDAVVMVGTPDGYRRSSESAFGVYVHIADVETRYARAKGEGAVITEEPTDQSYGVRSYGAVDPEGVQWWFAQPVSASGS